MPSLAQQESTWLFWSLSDLLPNLASTIAAQGRGPGAWVYSPMSPMIPTSLEKVLEYLTISAIVPCSRIQRAGGNCEQWGLNDLSFLTLG